MPFFMIFCLIFYQNLPTSLPWQPAQNMMIYVSIICFHIKAHHIGKFEENLSPCVNTLHYRMLQDYRELILIPIFIHFVSGKASISCIISFGGKDTHMSAPSTSSVTQVISTSVSVLMEPRVQTTDIQSEAAVLVTSRGMRSHGTKGSNDGCTVWSGSSDILGMPVTTLNTTCPFSSVQSTFGR